MADFDYDLECYPNFFSCYSVLDNRKTFIFEISEWRDDSVEFYKWLMGLKTYGHRMVGFNNFSYDYTLVHYFMENQGNLSYTDLYAKSQAYFRDGKGVQFNPHVLWENEQHIPQVDLYKIHHFDNANKRTSLKMIEFNMRSNNIKDLPFDPNLPLNYEQSRELLKYNGHDTTETYKFHCHTKPMIEFRDRLSEKYKKSFVNFSDAKIGAEVLMLALEKKGIHKKVNGVLNQTKRDSLPLGEVILPYIKFERPEFNEILEFFRKSTIIKKQKNGLLELKGFFGELHATLDGFQFDFGAGGIHGSIKNSIVRESESHVLLDWDVSSYYPNLAIKNKFFPEHLTSVFCDVQLSLFNERKTYAKKTPENASLKLSMNASYGNSSQIHSPMLDQKFTVSITINGQLLLCMLAEQLMKIPDLKMVQINTDGLTFLCPREYRDHANALWKWWEGLTQLELEENEYKAMYILHVNSYMAEYKDGGVKRIGAYAHELALVNGSTRELAWHKNQSAVVVAKAAEAALVRGVPIEEFIKNHDEPMDFMLSNKVDRNSSLVIRKDGKDIQLQKIIRYHMSTDGGKLIKTMPHTKTQKSNWKNGDHYQHEDTGEYQVVGKGKKPKSGKFKPVSNPDLNNLPPREIGINVKYLVSDCSSMNDFNPDTLDYNYYIEKTEDLVNPLLIGE